MNLSLEEARTLVTAALKAAGASPLMAASTARALVLAESQGQGGHGLSRVGQYATHLRNGRVNGSAQATVVRRKGGALLVDAQEGLAFPACDLALSRSRGPGAHAGRGAGGHHEQPPLRCGGRSPARGGRGRHGRPGPGEFAGRHAGGRRQTRHLRHQPDRRRVPAPRRGPAADRPEPVRSGARQGDAGGQEGRADSGRLGARRPGPAHDRCPGRARRVPCCRWALRPAPRARCWR